MRLDKWAVTAQETLQAAIGIASDAQAGALEPIHLLSALLESPEHNIKAILERVGADPAPIAMQVDDAVKRAPKVSGQGQMGMSNDALMVLNAAEKTSEQMGDSYVTSEHILCALAEACSYRAVQARRG